MQKKPYLKNLIEVDTSHSTEVGFTITKKEASVWFEDIETWFR